MCSTNTGVQDILHFIIIAFESQRVHDGQAVVHDEDVEVDAGEDRFCLSLRQPHLHSSFQNIRLALPTSAR
jgi:hypothetical protein